MDGKALSFYLSRDLDVAFRVRVTSMDSEPGAVAASTLLEHPETALDQITTGTELVVKAQVWADSKPLTAIVSTLHRPARAWNKWNEWLTFPIKYRQLPFSAQLALTVTSLSGVVYGGTTVALFDTEDCTLKCGRQKLQIWLDRPADGLAPSSTDSAVAQVEEMDRLERLIKRHESGDLVQIEWLDGLVFREIERINRAQGQYTGLKRPAHTDSVGNFLYIDLPRLDFPVVYSETLYTHEPHASSDLSQTTVLVSRHQSSESADAAETISPSDIFDPELISDNPIEAKFRRLTRSNPSGPLDRDLKPDAEMRDELQHLVACSPVHELSDDDKNLLWRFRHYLTREKRALTKFLRAIAWDNTAEAKQAIQLLGEWAEIDVDDALELLGPAFTNSTVRAYAVDRLRKANDKELELYLLQLVEALKFEATTTKSHLARFLVNRAVKNVTLGNYIYWYLVVEAQGGPGKDRANGKTSLYQTVLDQFTASLENQRPEGVARLATLRQQADLVSHLVELAVSIRQARETRPRKVERLRAHISDPKNGLLSFPPIPLPLDPSVIITGVIAEECSVFKSSLNPLKITFRTTSDNYSVIFKHGDDLRQDQLVIQIIKLMDQLLRNENLDLKLTPYRILATGSSDGAVQFVPNQTLAHVLAEYHGILPYLRQHAPDPETPLGVRPDVMDTYVRSCAGYCVITYILGVGDRHLDNLLICPDGHFFHVDYGYILGMDPKPFPPMMKLPIQIIDGMGGIQSENYDQFRKYCFTAYTMLRKSSNLIINLFALMTHASIPDIMSDPERAVQKVVDKFCLEMSEEEAMVHFQTLINDSVSAFLPMVIDRLHNFAQYWRS